MFPKSAIIAIIGTGLLGVVPVEGGDWMFRRSWFSHQPTMSHEFGDSGVMHGMTTLPPHELPNTRSAYRPAIPQRGPGFSIRSKERYNFYRLNNGRSYDTTIYREFSFEESP